MTVPTSDERREVAAGLREALGGRVAVECGKVAHALGLEYEAHGTVYCFGADAVRRLADLIDPTCHVVSDEKLFGSFGCEEAGRTFKLSCGHETTVDGDYLPSYCSECGAKVVSE